MKIEEFVRETGMNKPSFNTFRLRDRNPLGGTTKIRIISAPNDEMRTVHRRLIAYLRHLKIDLSSATGALPGCSPVANVAIHRRNRYFYLTDIHNAYPSTDGARLAEILYTLALNGTWDLRFRLADTVEQIHGFLKTYCLGKKEGPLIGAPASPDLFNLYCAALIDDRLRELCGRYGITYTRYLDDLTFSSTEKIAIRKRREINKIIRSAGLTLSNLKTRVLDLAKRPIRINGVGLELGGRIFLCGAYRRKLKGLLYYAMPFGETYAPQVSGLAGVFHGIYNTAKLQTRNEKTIAGMHDTFKRKVRRAIGRKKKKNIWV